MKLLVCGSRGFGTINGEIEALRGAIHALNPTILIHGDASGADRAAAGIAKPLKWITVIACPVTQEQYDKHGKAAPVLRNQYMLDEYEPDIVLATRGGKGTQDMIRRARKAYVPVVALIT